MKKLEIVFTKSAKLFPVFSWLIRLWTWKSYSHVARGGKLFFMPKKHFYQASEGKINYEYETYFIKKHKIVKTYTIDVPENLYYDMVRESWSQAGAKYGFMQNVGILIVDLASFIGLKIKNPFKSGQNCSELIYRTVLSKLYTDLNYDPDTIKPHQIEEILKKKCKK